MTVGITAALVAPVIVTIGMGLISVARRIQGKRP